MYTRHSCPYCGLDEDYLCVEDVEYKDGKLIFTMYCENCGTDSLIVYKEISDNIMKSLKEYKII